MIEQSDALLSFLFTQFLRTESPLSEETASGLTAALRESLTREPYATDDNKSAAEQLSLSSFKVGSQTYTGTVVLPSKTPISSLIWAFEDSDSIPEKIRELWPALSLAEWKAAMRFIVRLLSALEL